MTPLEDFPYFDQPLGISCSLVSCEEGSKLGHSSETPVILNQFIIPRTHGFKAYPVNDSNPLYYEITVSSIPSKVNFYLTVLNTRAPVRQFASMNVLAHFYKATK